MDRALIALVVILAAVLAFFPIRNSDIFQHLATGRLLVRGQYHFGADPFTHSSEPGSWANTLTGANVVWVNHSWLADYILYLLHLVEPEGRLLVVLKSLLVAGLAVLMLLAGHKVG